MQKFKGLEELDGSMLARFWEVGKDKNGNEVDCSLSPSRLSETSLRERRINLERNGLPTVEEDKALEAFAKLER